MKYGINQRLNVALLIGGVSFDEQERKLERGADVLIATPVVFSTILSAANCS